MARSRHALRSASDPSSNLIPLLSLVAALGVFAVATGYAAGRHGLWWGPIPYWAGEVFLFAPIFVRLFSPRPLSDTQAAGAVIVLAVGSYLVNVCYSPTQFRYVDELLQWRTVHTVLVTHHLFGANPALPVSPSYPGLANVTVALEDLTGLSVVAVGLTVAGLSHLLTTVGLFLLFRLLLEQEPTDTNWSPARLAALAAALYATGPNFQFFNAYFIYENPAMAFAVLTLVAATRLSARRLRGAGWIWAVVGLASAAVVVVTHHVTSWALVGLLLAGAIGAVLSRSWTGATRVALLALAVGGAVALWLVFVAPGTVSYLDPSVSAIAAGIAHLLSGRLGAIGTSRSPLRPAASPLAYGVAVVTVLGLLFGWWHLLRRAPRKPWSTGMALAAATYLVTVAVRIGASNGTELAGRSLAYVMIPVSFVMAMGFASGLSRARSRRRHIRHDNTIWSLAGLAGGLVLFVGGIASGWPPAWERLPHPYLPSAFESSVSAQGIAASRWAAHLLGPDNRFGSDYGNQALVSTIGLQVPVFNDVAPLFYSRVWTARDSRLAAAQNIQYLLVDLRLSKRLPPTGYYFPHDPLEGRLHSPIPVADLTKFNVVRGVNRVYDNGAIVIYNIEGTW